MLKLLQSTLKRIFKDSLRWMSQLSRNNREKEHRCLVFLFNIRKMVDQEINRYCATYYENKHPKHFLWREHSRYLYESVHQGERVLDIGCGASEYPQWISEKAQSVTCVDIRSIRVELARKNNRKENVFYERMDVTNELPAGRFDVAICSHVLEHLDDPVLFLQKLSEKVPRIIVKVPLDDSDWMKLVKKDLGMFWMDDTDHRREYSESMLREHLEKGGWHTLEMIRGYDLRATAISQQLAVPSKTPHASTEAS
jgi:SAM-dependent methyltransferase